MCDPGLARSSENIPDGARRYSNNSRLEVAQCTTSRAEHFREGSRRELCPVPASSKTGASTLDDGVPREIVVPIFVPTTKLYQVLPVVCASCLHGCNPLVDTAVVMLALVWSHIVTIHRKSFILRAASPPEQ